MALWGCMGQVSSIAQLVGVDMFGLLTMVVEGVKTVRRNEDECRRLAHSAAMIEDLLLRLRDSKAVEHPETWKPIVGLKGTLRQAYVLVTSCQRSSYAYRFCMGCEIVDRLQLVQKDMDLYYRHLSTLLQCIILDELTERLHRNTDSAQVCAGSSISHLDRNDSDDRGKVKGGLGKAQLVTQSYLPDPENIVEVSAESHRSRWCCWCPTKETATAPNTDMLIAREGSGLIKFTFSQLAHATNNFSLENEIGVGGSSTVYKAKLHEGLEVAVKRASCGGKTKFHHFETELELIPKLRHANIVKLLGYCIQKDERILVFEYMPNRSLDSFIYGKRASEPPLNWPQRSRIVEAVAQGALYLHKLCGPHIIHGDLKPGNILLDSDLNPKICDFGISRALKPGVNEDCTAVVTGSRGFIAPEYKDGGCVSVKSDVYSFGATLLQIISWMKFPPPPLALLDESRDYGPLNNWAWGLWRAGRLMEFIDPSLHDDPWTTEIVRWVQVALLCVQLNPEDRPSMWDVLVMLSCESVILQEPNLPAYY